MRVVPTRGGLLCRVGIHRRIEGAEDARAHLGREPPVQDEGAVILVPEGEAAILVLRIGAFGLLRTSRAAVEAGECLDVLGGAVQSNVEEIGFVVRGGDTGEGTNLGVAEFTLGEGFGEQGQFTERPGDADLLAGGVGVDTAGPSEPVGAGEGALGGPDLAAVELGDEGEEAVGGGVDVGGEGGDGGGERIVIHACGVVRIGGERRCHGSRIRNRQQMLDIIRQIENQKVCDP